MTERGGPQTMLLVSLEGVADYLTKLATPRAVELRKHWANGNLGRIKPWVTELPWWKTQSKPVDTAPLELEDDGEDDNEDEDMEDEEEEEDDEYYEDGDGEYHEDDTVEEDEDDDCVPPPQPNGRGVPGPVARVKGDLKLKAEEQPKILKLPSQDSECKDLVMVKNGMVIADSLGVAERFDKEHRNVLRDVRNLDCSVEFSQHNFVPSSYQGKNGKTLPMIEMTRDGFMLLVMGFTGKAAMQCKEAYIKAFNMMEAELRKPHPTPLSNISDDMLGMVRLMVQQQGQALSQQATLIEAMVGLSQAVQKMVNKVCPDFTIPNHPIERTIAPPTHFTIVGFASLIGIRVGEKDASAMGRRATKLCGSRGVEFKDVPNGVGTGQRTLILGIFYWQCSASTMPDTIIFC
jgi:Rha family phage regulatory protein